MIKYEIHHRRSISRWIGWHIRFNCALWVWNLMLLRRSLFVRHDLRNLVFVNQTRIGISFVGFNKMRLIERFDPMWTDWTNAMISSGVNWLNGFRECELITLMKWFHSMSTDSARWAFASDVSWWHGLNWLGDFIWSELIAQCRLMWTDWAVSTDLYWLNRLSYLVWCEQTERSQQTDWAHWAIPSDLNCFKDFIWCGPVQWFDLMWTSSIISSHWPRSIGSTVSSDWTGSTDSTDSTVSCDLNLLNDFIRSERVESFHLMWTGQMFHLIWTDSTVSCDRDWFSDFFWCQRIQRFHLIWTGSIISSMTMSHSGRAGDSASETCVGS
jgi:hypothetical protein